MTMTMRIAFLLLSHTASPLIIPPSPPPPKLPLPLRLAAIHLSLLALPAAAYDGFASYAAHQQMERSDLSCFVTHCATPTRALLATPRGVQGIACLGRCKGQQICATRCFAQFGSSTLDDWLGCAIEDHPCVKVPRDNDYSAEDQGFPGDRQTPFDARTLLGTWYKTDGLNPNYDLFDCQQNSFRLGDDGNEGEFDMDIQFRLPRPVEYGGGYWENHLVEHMIVDESSTPQQSLSRRNMHTAGKMYGLKFEENWYILGESLGENGIPPFKLVGYRGHTLQGNYDGAFVYAKERVLPREALPAVRDAAARAGLNFDDFQKIDNSCPVESASLNDASLGMGTSATDWFELVVGEGGIIDWIVPGWRGEYKK